MLVVAATLNGCAAAIPTPTDAPAADIGQSTAPAPSADPLSTVTALVASPDAIVFQDDAGTAVARFQFGSDTGAVRAALEEVFDGEPVSEEQAGSSEHAPSTVRSPGTTAA